MVILQHLQKENLDGSPHNPSNPVCKELCRPRTLSNYRSEYNENLIDDRNSSSRRKNDNQHASVAEAMLFPLKDENLDQILPPVLHIMLGVVLLLYNSLLSLCQSIDAQENPDFN